MKFLGRHQHAVRAQGEVDFRRRIRLMVPDTRYVRTGDVSIAYQVIGKGPMALVLVPGWISNIEIFWEDPNIARFLQRLADFSRLVVFDKRGTGLSDRITEAATLEERMDDVRAVMDALGLSRAALLGYSEGGSMCLRRRILSVRRL